jgi:hypothetical protein
MNGNPCPLGTANTTTGASRTKSTENARFTCFLLLQGETKLAASSVTPEGAAYMAPSSHLYSSISQAVAGGTSPNAFFRYSGSMASSASLSAPSIRKPLIFSGYWETTLMSSQRRCPFHGQFFT